MTDFIIVGQGLAASVLAHTFHNHNISFKLIGNPDLSSCSRVAAGIWNPVVFKRLTKSWMADELITELNSFYSHCEGKLQQKLITQRPIIKPFTEDQEKKLWLKKASEELHYFLDEALQENTPTELAGCLINNGFGKVKHSGNLDVAEFLNASFVFFKDHILLETFDHSQLEISPDKLNYRTIEARNIVFCEGYLVKENPYFSWIPLKPAKGEILTLEAHDLHLNKMVFNRNGFLMDLSPGIFKAGATYEWNDLSETPTDKGLEELKEKIKQMATCEYTVLKHEAGIRPSSSDRRPIVGSHPHHKNLLVFNGLGTKGVMLAPFFAKNFVHFYLQNQSLHSDVNVNRFYPLYEGQKA